MKPVALALVGCGNISHMHVTGYQPYPERVRFVAACDPVPAARERAAAEYGIPHTFDSVAAMLAGSEWDVAVVCTPTDVREATISALAAGGKDIFVEKPLADSYDEAARMVAACDAAGVRLAVNQNFRYHYPFDTARQLIAAGRIGAPVAIAHQELTFRQDKGWRTGLDRHALSIMGVHWFDGFRWLLADEPTSLSCHLRSSGAIAAAGETEVALTIKFGQGVIVSYAQSFSSRISRTETVVIGESATLRLTYAQLEIIDEPGGEASEIIANPYRGAAKPGASYHNLDHLLKAIAANTEPPHGGRDNLRTVQMLDAAYASSRTGAPVLLNEEVSA